MTKSEVMKYSITFCFVVFIAVSSSAQLPSTLPSNVRAANSLDGIKDGGLSPGELLYGIPMAPGNVIGDNFLKDEWEQVEIHLRENDRYVKGISCKYNLKTQEIFIRVPNGDVRALSVSKITSLRLTNALGENSSYINADKYVADDGRPIGLLHVLTAGKYKLLQHAEIKVIKPNYRQEFDMGSKDTKLVKKFTYFMVTEDSHLVELDTRSKSKLAKSLASRWSELSQRIKASDLNTKDEHELIRFFESAD